MSTPKPSVGRVAHYVARGSADGVFPPACRAATITEVVHEVTAIRDGTGAIVGSRAGKHTVGLAVLNPTGLFFHPVSAGGADYDPGEPLGADRADADSEGLCSPRQFEGGSWHWPARVDEDTARSAARGQRAMDRR